MRIDVWKAEQLKGGAQVQVKDGDVGCGGWQHNTNSHIRAKVIAKMTQSHNIVPTHQTNTAVRDSSRHQGEGSTEGGGWEGGRSDGGRNQKEMGVTRG